jgi:outer membrane protein OmpA-like peptidoglycan-associated protein
VAINKGWKIRLRGSCDSATASAEYNQRLSERRCQTILSELLKMGVPESQTIVVPVGGVHELNPTEFDRRVLIELVKEVK